MSSRLSVLLVFVVATMFLSGSAAAVGEYRFVTGVLLWPDEVGPHGLAVVQGDDGVTYFAELSLATRPLARAPAIPPRAGDRVTLVGREGYQQGQVLSAAIEPAPPAPTTATGDVGRGAPAAAITGQVERVRGRYLELATRDGRRITVDISELDAGVRQDLMSGQEVTVLTARRQDGALIAGGVVIEVGSMPPSALPRSRE